MAASLAPLTPLEHAKLQAACIGLPRNPRPDEPEFFVNRNHPLAILKEHRAAVFALQLPEIYGEEALKKIREVLADSSWKGMFPARDVLASTEAAAAELAPFSQLPISCFSFGTPWYGSEKPSNIFIGEDPFSKASPASDWYGIDVVDLLCAMRLVQMLRARSESEGSAMEYRGPLTDERLDGPLPIRWTLREPPDRCMSRVIREFGPPGEKTAASEPNSTDTAAAKTSLQMPPTASEPLTLRKLIGMVSCQAYHSQAAEALGATYLYVANVIYSPYFTAFRSTLLRRYDPASWRILLRPRPLPAVDRIGLAAARFTVDIAPRLPSTDVMTDCFKHFHEAVAARRLMGPNGAL